MDDVSGFSKISDLLGKTPIAFGETLEGDLIVYEKRKGKFENRETRYVKKTTVRDRFVERELFGDDGSYTMWREKS